MPWRRIYPTGKISQIKAANLQNFYKFQLDRCPDKYWINEEGKQQCKEMLKKISKKPEKSPGFVPG